MSVSARLAQKLNEQLGEEAAADMVDWMQRVDAQRSELRDLNELNFARFEERFARVDQRFVGIDQRFDQLEARVDLRFKESEARIVGRIEAKIEQRTADLMKWSFVFWVGAVTVIAVLAGVLG